MTEAFTEHFHRANKAGKKQYLVPYYIASHPGSDLNATDRSAVIH
ncbi:MAG: hypothetical protein R3C05_24490 [Pirellulaceae bacterium]